MEGNEPAYLKMLRTGLLEQRAQEAYRRLEACDVCDWKCGVNRHSRKQGICRVGVRAMVSSYGPHLAEETVLTGRHGSGTIFFTRCSLHCQFCQNHEISQGGFGIEVTPDELAEIMLELERRGCHNINLVTPSHVIPQIIAAVSVAAKKGLALPLVYNTGGYDSIEGLRLLDGIVDIYMPDMKYADEVTAHKYSKVPHYPRSNREAVQEMYRQVGDLQVGPDGLAWRGLLVRHLVLPNRLAGTAETARFLAEKISPRTYLHLMDQYVPMYHAAQYPELNRRITAEEFEEARQWVTAAGLTPSNGKKAT